MTPMTHAVVKYVPVPLSRRRQWFVAIATAVATIGSAAAFVNRHTWFAEWYEMQARREGRADAEKDWADGTAHLEFIGARRAGPQEDTLSFGHYDRRTGPKVLKFRGGDFRDEFHRIYLESYNSTVVGLVAANGPPSNSVLNRFRDEDVVRRELVHGLRLAPSSELRLPGGRRIVRVEGGVGIRNPDGSDVIFWAHSEDEPSPRVAWDATAVFVAFENAWGDWRCWVFDTEMGEVVQCFL